MSITAYPLSWPLGWERTKSYRINRSRFDRPSMEKACNGTIQELVRMGVSRQDIVISTNIRTRIDGMPYSNSSQPTDKGVAVYFRRKGKDHVMAADGYDRVEDNLWAVAKSLEAMRAIERYGVTQVMDRAFSGFAALPEKATARTPSQIFGFDVMSVSADALRNRYKELCFKLHPDRNPMGIEDFHEVQCAWEIIKSQRRDVA